MIWLGLYHVICIIIALIAIWYENELHHPLEILSILILSPILVPVGILILTVDKLQGEQLG